MAEEMRALGELAIAGWPVGLTLAAVVATDRLRWTRRRDALNRALHELRRPLQALALAPAVPRNGRARVAADLALGALDDLDREINGSPRVLALRPVACRSLVECAVERWRGPAAAARHSLHVHWQAGAAIALADPRRVAQALDNLLSNAIEHGGLLIWIEATVCARGVRIGVSNSIRRATRDVRPAGHRRGHGLRVVSEIAAAHGGRLAVRRSADTWTSILELPLADRPIPAANSALAASAACTEERMPVAA